MSSGPKSVGQWNDELALEHDIDDYYERSGPVIRWVERRRLALIVQLLALEPGQRLLEVGCGGGHVLRLFPEADAVGVDVSGVMLDKARKTLAQQRVTLHQGELAELGLPRASFDRLICTEVLEHVAEPGALLAEMRRLLRPDGIAVVTMPNDPLIMQLQEAVKRTGLHRLPLFGRVAWGGDKYHLHQWQLEQMRELLRPWFTIAAERFAPLRVLPIRCCFRCLPR
jgi:ubiquinone/menaquinone biosynthesis C-methylase UbiE